MTIEQQIADLEAHAKRLDEQSARLIDRYGEGVRPGWISADLAMNGHHAAEARAEAAKLREGEQCVNS